jgi:hypothetical protein
LNARRGGRTVDGVEPTGPGGAVAAVHLAPVLAMIGTLALALALFDRWLSGRSARRRPRRARSAPPAEPVRRPLQVVAADLRRITRQLALVPSGAPLVRWQALWAAYDGVLIEAAEQLQVPHELPSAPLGMARDLERLRLLAALEGAGLVVHG